MRTVRKPHVPGGGPHRPPDSPIPYIPVYTLHDLQQETGESGQVPVVICSGCGHDIKAPRGSANIQCRDCGRKMQVKAIQPATQATRI